MSANLMENKPLAIQTVFTGASMNLLGIICLGQMSNQDWKESEEFSLVVLAVVCCPQQPFSLIYFLLLFV